MLWTTKKAVKLCVINRVMSAKKAALLCASNATRMNHVRQSVQGAVMIAQNYVRKCVSADKIKEI